MSTELDLSRRSFLLTSSLIGSAFVLGFHLPANAANTPDTEINAWIVISADDTVTIRVAHSEMGQGSFTALTMLVAEELNADWSKVKAAFVDPRENITRKKIYGSMSTIASNAVRKSQEYLRNAGASAREMLLSAAAQKWKVPANECVATRGVITHTPSKRTLSYGAVAAAAAKLTPPEKVTLKDPVTWTIAGKPTKRLDIPDKVHAKPIYAIDVVLPDMLHAAIVQCPVFGGKLRSYDESSLRNHKGITKVVPLENAVAVIGESYWQAQRAAKALAITWDEGANADVSSAGIATFIDNGLAQAEAPSARNDGDTKGALAKAAKVVEATYRVPFLSHAPMETQNATLRFNPDGTVDVWAPTQNTEAVMSTVAKIAGIDPLKVTVHITYSGGGFGRRYGPFGTSDYLEQATKIAMAVDKPVKMIWSREEDIQHDYYRPVSAAKFTAGLDTAGNLVAWNTRISGHSLLSMGNPAAIKNNMDEGFLIAFTDNPYAVENLHLDYAMRNTPIPVGYWRSTHHSQNGYFRECFFDEIARAAGQDPYEYRRKYLAKAPKQLAVLDTVAKAIGWDTPAPKGIFRGIAQVDAYESFVATAVEISLNADGTPRVHRVISAIDCGTVVNPDSTRSQMEGSVVWALTAGLYDQITIKNGRVEQGNFDTYPMLRLADMPEVEIHLVPSGGFFGGVGEPGAAAVMPAVCNAMLAATGKPVRELPVIKHNAATA